MPLMFTTNSRHVAITFGDLVGGCAVPSPNRSLGSYLALQSTQDF